MTSVPEISVVRAPSPPAGASGDASAGGSVGVWTPVDAPRATGPSPTWLVVLALLAGIGAMVLGGLAVVSATRSSDDATATAAAGQARTPAATDVERRVLTLLGKPSTERFVFRGSGGELVLAVGSGGRAAILIQGLERAPVGRPYRAWVTVSGRPVRAAQFTGAERAVFLSVPVARGESVAVATERASAIPLASARIVATRR